MAKHKFFVLIFVILIFAMTACSQNTQAPVNTQATIDAAVAATANAQIAMQSAIDEAVHATSTAQAIEAQAAANAQVTALAEANPTATPTPVVAATEAPSIEDDTVATMSEDELAALIDEAVADAYAASNTYSDAATTATADNTVTQEEVQNADMYYMASEEAIAYAEELISLYASMYGDLAYEAVDELYAIEDDLEALTEAVLLLNDTMTDIANILDEGLTVDEETLIALANAAQQIDQNTVTAQANSEAWHEAYQSYQNGRLDIVMQYPPTQIEDDPVAAIQSAIEFAQTGKTAMDDYQVTAEELATLAQLSANASASLSATGNVKLQDLSTLVSSTTMQMARGDYSQALANLDQLGLSLDALKTLPDFQNIQLPTVPSNVTVPSAPSLPAITLPSRPR